jgi:DNA-binding MarR family transcriptional regulator
MPNHYESLAELDYQMQRFERLSDQAAQNAGLQPLAAKLLLALKGLPEEGSPTVGEIAERLHVRHHTVVGVVNRLVGRGFLVRCRGAWDRRVVLLLITPAGESVVRDLVQANLRELRNGLGSSLTRTITRTTGQGWQSENTDTKQAP